MTDAQHEAIQALRKAGYAVAVFSPEELDGVSFRDIEDVMVRNGNEAIEDLRLQSNMGEEE